MSKSSQSVMDLLKKVKPRWPIPSKPKRDLDLMEYGLMLVLMRHLTQTQAEASVNALSSAYADWNEVRVSQAQEISSHLKTSSRKKGFELQIELKPAALAIKEFLQEVFQQTHSQSLEFVREDVNEATKIFAQMPFLGLSAGSQIMAYATDGAMPVHLGMVRVLDRAGLITRTSSLKKAREMLGKLVPLKDVPEFTVRIGDVVDRWCDSRKPLCHECPLVDTCKYGIKAYKDWQGQQARLKIQMEKEEKRRIIAEKKEADRLRLEADRMRKKAEAAAKRQTKQLEKQRKMREREKAAIAKKKADAAAVKKKAADAIKAKAAAAKKKAADKKKAAAKKKVTKKKVVKKKVVKKTTKKAAVSKKKATKKPATKKAPAKKAAAKKTAKKPTASKKVAKKAPASKKATKKAPAKKKVTKKKAAKKTTRRR